MIYVMTAAYFIVISLMAFTWTQKTKYYDEYHICFKGFYFTTLMFYIINKFTIWCFDGAIRFYYIPCIVLSLFVTLYLQWKHFNDKDHSVDKIYRGKFSTIKSLINTGVLYHSDYDSFCIVKERKDRWARDNKIQITLSFPEYICYCIFLLHKQKQDYLKQQAKSNLEAANEIKDILSDYVTKNKSEAEKYIQESKDLLEQIKNGNLSKQNTISADTSYIPERSNPTHNAYCVLEKTFTLGHFTDYKTYQFITCFEAEQYIAEAIRNIKNKHKHKCETHYIDDKHWELDICLPDGDVMYKYQWTIVYEKE